ncbi:MAG: gliding motility lipoprotein GldB [Flavobacteriaceae bacterium]|nr:gliding motility lipoprotein GldB [Flavobacteriaceae bacterium]
MRYLKHFFFAVLIAASLVNCTPKSKLAIDTSAITVDFEVVRFDSIFYSSKPHDFAKIKSAYPYMLSGSTPDSVWVNEMGNPDSQFLFQEVQKVFPDFNRQTDLLSQLFKHVKYYYPKFKAPKVVTLISDIDYNNKVIYADSLLLLSLDMYLGNNHSVYQNFPKYIKASYTKAYLPVDVAKAIVLKSLPNQTSRIFISKCIQQGKLLYASKAFLPNLPDTLLMGYTKMQIDWARANQESVWKYFVENNMIFNTDKDLVRRFLIEAPFSKFYLENDKDTPGRIGAFIGFKIVESFVKNNNVSLVKMLQTPNEILFKNSKYKPRN